MYDKNKAPTEEQIKKYEFLVPMLDSAIKEMREFSKKKQNGIVSSTKTKILNRLLTDFKEILANEESVNYLDPLNDQELPQNSDAVIILGQYRSALKTFKNKHHKNIYFDGERKHTWITKEWIEAYENDEDMKMNDEDRE